MTGWLLDGGVPMVLLWLLALVLTMRAVARVGLGRGPQYELALALGGGRSSGTASAPSR